MSQELPQPISSMMHELAKGLVKILGERLIGLYLGGSLSLGDFQAASSDLDFLALTDGPLSVEDGLAVALLHKALLRRFPEAARLQGDYAPVQWIVPEGTTAPVPGCEHGRFLPRVGEIMLSADNIYNMREDGILIYGRPPAETLPAVSGELVRKAVRTMLNDGLGAMETPAEAADELLNLLRSLRSLESGTPSTKTQGAHWALERLEAHWHPLIRAAQAIRCGEGSPVGMEVFQDRLPELVESVRHYYAGVDSPAGRA